MTNRHSKFGIALVSLAFFFFLLMECTLYYQSVLQPYPSSESFLRTQLPVLGASALGYLTFPVFARKVKRAGRRVLAVAFTAVGLLCLAAEYACPSEQGVFWMGCLSFYLLGIAGGGSLWACSVVLSSSTHVALWVAGCHAVGMGVQTALSLLPLGHLAETVLLGGAIVAFVAFTMATWPSMKSAHSLPPVDTDYSFYERKPFPYRDVPKGGPDAPPMRLAVTICLVAGIFSILFNLLYSTVPDGALSVAERTDVFARLALIAGGLIMGVIINIGNGKHMGASILCVALVAALAAFASRTGADQTVCQVLFFMGWGAFVVFYTMATIWIAPFMKIPQLWAGMGRVVTSAVAIIAWLPTAAIASRSDSTIVAIVLFAILIAVIIVINAADPFLPREKGGTFLVSEMRPEDAEGAPSTAGAPGNNAVGGNDARKENARDENSGSETCAIGAEGARDEGVSAKTSAKGDGRDLSETPLSSSPAPKSESLPPLSPEELLERFSSTYNLTPREVNVLAAVVQDERPLKQVAADLDVTIRTVQRHLTSIYQKTGTQTRAGLAVRFYYAGKTPSNAAPENPANDS